MKARGQGSLYKQKGSEVWWASFYNEGRRQRMSTGTTNRRLAEIFLRDKMAEVSQGTYNEDSRKVTVSDLVKDKLTAAKLNGNDTVNDDETRWRLHLQPFFGKMLASKVTTPLLRKYIGTRFAAEKKPKNGQVNRELALLRAAMNQGYKSTPPLVQRVPHFPMLKEDNKRMGFLTDAQYDALATECTKAGVWLRTVMEIGATYGWRKSEILGLQVRQIDLAAKCIRLDSSKNGDGREVALTSTLIPLLTACIDGKAQNAPVFTWQPGHRLVGKPVKDMRDQWAACTKAAGVPGLYVHDLRRTGARNLRRAGIPESVVMKIGGWRTNEVFRRYAIVDSKDMAEAVRKIEADRAERNSHSLDIVAPESGRNQKEHQKQVQ